MKNSVLTLLFFCLFTTGYTPKNLSLHSFGQVTQEQKDLIHEKVEFLPNQAQLAIALLKNGELNFYGVKREKGKILGIDNHSSIFEIGSITKVFTGTLLAHEVQAGQIKQSLILKPNSFAMSILQ